MRCKPVKQFIFTYSVTSPKSCFVSFGFVSFDTRQIWKYFYIWNDLVELWRGNVSVRVEKEVFEKCFKECEE